MAIKIYNTLTNKKEIFEPLEDHHVKIYSCGPTVYDYVHIGNARAFVVPDVIRNYLKYSGYKVTYVQNITDIDDKIIERAKAMATNAKEIAERFTKAYTQDMEALGIERPDYTPAATQHIEDIIKLICTLEERGYTYKIGNSIYYDISRFPEYGCLSNQKLEDLISGARVEADDRKRNPGDFVLWKESKENEPFWESPWGRGRPGWHIECSAMSMKYLGHSFDIHAGGADLTFPHHENEIAQSEAVTGCPFVKYWVHNGYINIHGEKMSKSKGNILTVRELLKKYSPAAIRYFLISKHYRSPINYSEGEMEAALSAVQRISNTIILIQNILEEEDFDGSHRHSVGSNEIVLSKIIDEAESKFVDAMDDDFNTAAAMGGIFELIKHVNSFINSNDYKSKSLHNEVLARAGAIIERYSNILGIYFDDAFEKDDYNQNLINGLIDLILEIRQDARVKKEWDTADKIRDSLDELGIVIEDSPKGPRWRLKR